jgi:hypothetical protein
MALGILSGCQQTPDHPLVVGKEQEKMLAQAKSNENGKASLFDNLNISDRYSVNLKNKSGNVSVNANADVVIPDATKIPVLSVSQREITQNEVDILAKELMRSKEIFEQPADGKILRTKEQIDEQLLYYRGLLSNNRFDIYPKEEVQRRIADLEKKYQTAPETLAGYHLQKSDGKLKTQGQVSSLKILCNMDESHFASLGVINDLNECNVSLSFNAGYDVNIARKTTISFEQAKNIAQELLNKLGLDSFKLTSANTLYAASTVNPTEHTLTFARNVDGIPIFSEGVQGIRPDSTYQKSWTAELITMKIDDTGVIMFDWRSPYRIGDYVTQNSKLLSFDAISSIFEKMMPVVYEDVTKGNEDMEAEFDISKIELMLMRVLKQGKNGSGILIPVWNYYGTYHQSNEQEKDKTVKCVLTINAIDGSIIDVYQGY